MIRRSRISVRPNVGRPGKAGGTATPQDEPTPSQMPAEPPAKEEDNTNTTALQAGGDSNNDSTPAGLTTAGQGKRFSVKPKVSAAPARASARGPNPDPDTHVQASKPTAREGPAGPPGSDLDEPSPPPPPPGEAAAAEAQHVDPVAQARQEGDGSGDKHGKPSAHIPDPAQEARVERDENPKGLPASRAKGDVLPKSPEKIPTPVPPSLPDREALEISERAKSLVSKSGREARGGLMSMSKKHRDRKSRCRAKEYALDPSKMTMRDLVHYLPESNPMSSYLEASTPENETVVPRSPAREEPPQDPETASQGVGDTGGGEVDEDEEEEEEGGGDDGVMVPRLKVGEDGSLIIDEEREDSRQGPERRGRRSSGGGGEEEEEAAAAADGREEEDPDYVGEGEGGRGVASDASATPTTAGPVPLGGQAGDGDSSPQKPKIKTRKRSKKAQAEASVPEEAEATLPEDRSTADGLEEVDRKVKPAKPPQAREFKPLLLPRGRKPGKGAEPPGNSKDTPGAKSQDAPGANSQDAPDTGETLTSDAQVAQDPSPSTHAKKRKLKDSDDSEDHDEQEEEEEEEFPAHKINLKPTRYGRVPKATQHLQYAAKEDSSTSARPRPPSTSTPKRAQSGPSRSKKPKLVTLRASQSECSDEDDDDEEAAWKTLVEMEEEEQRSRPHASDGTATDSHAPAFGAWRVRSWEMSNTSGT
ncbi:hypothetical protein CRUP_001798 [Coryphaenoides rupestris]|nr:hypothetical protein CRUP_001798 [Coryphaenoides rupestris]